MQSFRGAGGVLGGSPSQPVNTPDNLSSTDQVEIVLGLVQGPIKGLTNGNQSFYVGTTQLENADGSTNFDLFNLTIYTGETPATPIIPQLGGYTDYRPLFGTQLTPGGPQSFTTQTPGLTEIIISIEASELFTGGTDVQLASLPGNSNTYSTFLPNSVDVLVTYQSPGGAVINPFGKPVTLTGKTQVGEPFEIRFQPTGSGPWTVYVEKVSTPDNYTTFSTIFLMGYFEVQGGVFGGARSTSVMTNLVTGVPLTRTTLPPNQNPNGSVGINMIAVRIDVNQLLYSDNSGTNYDTVNLLIESKPTSSTIWSQPFGGQVGISGKTTSLFVQEYRWSVDQIADTYDVRITIASPDLVNHYRSLAWESMEEIVGGPMTYDGLACAYVLGQSTGQFNSVPSLSGEYDLLLCHIPSNYNPYTRVYTGSWDGTFNLDWTSNPALCLYELAMNATWGAVSYWPHFNLNKYDIYAAAQWCDTMVPNGQGGLQPRYTFNGLISSPRGIRDQLRYMAGMFNGTYLDDLNGNTRVVFDSNEDAVAVFGQENVIEGMFNYTYTDPSTQFNYITGSYDEPNLLYQTVPLLVQDPNAIAQNGRTPTNIALVGCTNGHEALRRLTYKLISATTEMEIVSFSTNRAGLMLRPFHIILISDPDMGYGLSGRIRDIDATRTIVYLRDLLPLDVGVTYIFQTQVVNSDYPSNSSDPIILFEATFSPFVSGGTFAIEFANPLPTNVMIGAQFTVGAAGTASGVPKPYRITKIEPVDGNIDLISIEAIEVNRNKFALADNATTQTTYDPMNLATAIVPPTNLAITTNVVSVNGQAIANVVATWVASLDSRVVSYVLQYRRSGDTIWTTGTTTRTTRGDLYNIPNGVYDFAVQAISISGAASAFAYQFGKASGLDVPPSDVTSLTITQGTNNLNLQWTPIPDGDLSYYWIRYSPLTDGSATWVTATDLVKQISATNTSVPSLSGTYFIKAVDTSGVASVNAASAIAASVISNSITVENIAQQPTWPGSSVNMTVGAYGVLAVNIASNPSGSYTWDSEDFGSVFVSTIALSMVVSASDLSTHISDWTTLSEVENLAGVTPGSYLVDTSIALSTDGVTFGAFQPFATGTWTGRKFRFRVTLTSLIANVAPEITSCSAVISMTDRIVRVVSVYCPSTGLNVVFSPIFHVTPTLIPTILNAQSGDYCIPSSISNTGFTLTCYDGSSTAVGRNVSYIVVGYGVS